MSAKTQTYRAVSMSMDICGRVSVSPGPDVDDVRLKPVSSREMERVLDGVKANQARNVVEDTLQALVTDVNATAEILRRANTRSRSPEPVEEPILKTKKQVEEFMSEPVVVPQKAKEKHQPKPPAPEEPKLPQRVVAPIRSTAVVREREVVPEVEYKLRMSPQVAESRTLPFPTAKRPQTETEEPCSVDKVCEEYGVDAPPADRASKRARSETPLARRVIQIENMSGQSSDVPICAACGEGIHGACITALAPNSVRAQKFHPTHFVCTYCQKALNLRGTYKEHDRKPYCHECFYRLYSGHVYEVENGVATK